MFFISNIEKENGAEEQKRSQFPKEVVLDAMHNKKLFSFGQFQYTFKKFPHWRKLFLSKLLMYKEG